MQHLHSIIQHFHQCIYLPIHLFIYSIIYLYIPSIMCHVSSSIFIFSYSFILSSLYSLKFKSINNILNEVKDSLFCYSMKPCVETMIIRRSCGRRCAISRYQRWTPVQIEIWIFDVRYEITFISKRGYIHHIHLLSKEHSSPIETTFISYRDNIHHIHQRNIRLLFRRHSTALQHRN